MNRRGGSIRNVTSSYYKFILLLSIAIVAMFQFVLFTTTTTATTMNDVMMDNRMDGDDAPLTKTTANSDIHQIKKGSSGIRVGNNGRRLGNNNDNIEEQVETKKDDEKETSVCSVSNLLQQSSKLVTTSQQQNHQQSIIKRILHNIQRRLFSPLTKTKKKTKPCALLFFGLAKQFREITLPSIQEHILNIPENVKCDIYAHTYDVTTVTGKSHKNESDVVINPREIYDLTSNVVLDTNEEFELQRNMRRLLNGIYLPTRRMGWSKESLGNLYRQWHSIERVWDYMEETENKLGIQYERVGLFRSDVKYATPINIFEGSDRYDAVIPKFGFLVNDRMFYGLRQYAQIWSKIRFSGMKFGCYKPRHSAIGMHSEFYMKDFVLTKIPTGVYENEQICFYRVRSNGEVSYDDCTKKYDFPPFLIEAGLITNAETEERERRTVFGVNMIDEGK